MLNESIVIGKHSVLELLKSNRCVNKIWLQDGIHGKQYKLLLALIKEKKVMVQIVPKKKLDQLTSGNHQGVVAQVAPIVYASVQDIINKAKEKQEPAFILLLDELVDPHNVGAILRTADASGVHGVIIPKHRSALITETVVKVAVGAVENIPIARVTNLSQTIDILKKQNIWVMGAATYNSEDFRLLDAKLPLCLVIGNEGQGISKIIAQKCDFSFHIPMTGKVESLNASVAAALMMYEVYRKRNLL